MAIDGPLKLNVQLLRGKEPAPGYNARWWLEFNPCGASFMNHRLIIGRSTDKDFSQAQRDRIATIEKDQNIRIMTYDTLLRAYRSGWGFKKCVLSTRSTSYLNNAEGRADLPAALRGRPSAGQLPRGFEEVGNMRLDDGSGSTRSWRFLVGMA